jgi:hypothetical protein
MLRRKIWDAAPRILPPTIMSWANGPPPSQWRLPIDDELIRLASRGHRPCIRSDLEILSEFPTLKWNGPYRAARFYLYGFLWFGMKDNTALHVRSNRNTQRTVDLLRHIQESIHAYVDAIEGHNRKRLKFPTATSQETAWDKNFEALKSAVANAEFLEKNAQDALGDYEKGGRPPVYWKSDLVSELAELWRIMARCFERFELIICYFRFSRLGKLSERVAGTLLG